MSNPVISLDCFAGFLCQMVRPELSRWLKYNCLELEWKYFTFTEIFLYQWETSGALQWIVGNYCTQGDNWKNVPNNPGYPAIKVISLIAELYARAGACAVICVIIMVSVWRLELISYHKAHCLQDGEIFRYVEHNSVNLFFILLISSFLWWLVVWAFVENLNWDGG